MPIPQSTAANRIPPCPPRLACGHCDDDDGTECVDGDDGDADDGDADGGSSNSDSSNFRCSGGERWRAEEHGNQYGDGRIGRRMPFIAGNAAAAASIRGTEVPPRDQYAMRQREKHQREEAREKGRREQEREEQVSENNLSMFCSSTRRQEMNKVLRNHVGLAVTVTHL